MVSVNEMVLMVATSVGWVGAVGTVVAYALVSRRRLDANSMRFQTINVVGAGLLAVSAMSASNWPSTVSNLVWASVGAHALFQARHALRDAIVRRWQALWADSSPVPSTTDRADDEVLLAA